ncbi:putative major capsid protein [Pseudomonas phage OBP]|uniref:major head protein n=1 Tax=Pseudomonas phage OBP TaxID=1124849 RepID=UPI000240D4AA|nr:major head protein [Pseudomonas phage OBP]AEV89561.1 putative major capsid protein [Pseudomonas phage OBP]
MEQNNEFRFGISKSGVDLKALMTGVVSNQQSDGTLRGLVGAESMTDGLKAIEKGMGFNQKNAISSLIADSGKFNSRAEALKAVVAHGGMESFSMQLDAGNVARQKAATIELNARSNRQWDAAEALYPTLIIPYDQEALVLPIDIAGVGAYNASGNANEAFEDLRPIASVLADSKFNAGDDLKLVPVLPANPTDANAAMFVPSADWAPWDTTYDANDLLGREAHKTNFLAIRKINNLLSLCRAPGATAFEQNDEIEASSIKLNRILLKLKTKDGEGFVTLDTASMAGVAARPSTGTTADEKRQINFVLNGLNVANLKDKDGKATELFKSLTDAGLKVFLSMELSATYHRSTRSWSPTVSPVAVAYVINKDGDRLVVGHSNMPADIATLITDQAVEASIHGVDLKMNHANTNRSRYGTTVVYANTTKSYNIQRRQPISVKYPMLNDDNNADVLAMLVQQMDIMVTRNMSHDAFKAANQHFAYVYDNNGMKIVNINDDSSSVLPGQHFLGTVGIESEIDLITEVSTLDSKDTLANIEAALVNKVYDIITGLRVRSNISALKELDGREEAYTIIAHASLAPFLMRTGDYRTFGTNVKFKVLETNIDSEVGRMWVIPESQTKNGVVDIFGGMGICVAKELLVIEGSVNQSDRQYRMIITQPAYQHHSLCPVAGRLTIKDIDKLMGDEGLIALVNKHLVTVNGKLEGAAGGTGKEIEVEIPGTNG